ncbi:MAG: lspA [Gemmatimonadetes bacterium]|nr:lspA [Gemmatimonadota bacterium]
MPPRSPNGRVFWSAAALIVALDLWSKWLAVSRLTLHIPRAVMGEWVRFTLAYNPGAAFSMSLGPWSRVVFGAFASIALVVLWRLERGTGPGEGMKALALGLAWGGAAGNLIDRFKSPQGVVDFIDVGTTSWRFWTFNVADSAVTVGAVLLGLVLLEEDRRLSQAKKLAESSQHDARDTPDAARE